MMLLSAGSGRRRAFRRWQPSGSSSPSEPSLASDARTLAPKLFNSIRGPVEPTGPASVGPAPRRPELADRERRSAAEAARIDAPNVGARRVTSMPIGTYACCLSVLTHSRQIDGSGRAR